MNMFVYFSGLCLFPWGLGCRVAIYFTIFKSTKYYFLRVQDSYSMQVFFRVQ